MKRFFKRSWLLAILFAIALGPVVSVQNAQAFQDNDALPISEQQARTQLYAIGFCLTERGVLPNPTREQLNDHNIFLSNAQVAVGHEIDAADGTRECKSMNFDAALKFVGLTWDDTFVAMYENDNGNFTLKNDAVANLDNKLKTARESKRQSAADATGPKEKNRRVLVSLSRCIQQISDSKIGDVDLGDGKKYEFRKDKDGGDRISTGHDLNPRGSYECDTLINLGKTAIKDLPEGTTLNEVFNNPKLLAGGDSSVEAADDNEAGTNCQGGAMGWLFCPLIQAMASTVQLAANLIDELMQVRFLAQEGPSSQIETAWRAFLSVANIALVIAFMFIIFSQATSAGLSNYGIKRMLPRLIIAAILMNLSFYICALAIDISNILGASIMGFLIGSGNSVSSSIEAATGGTGAASILGWLAAGAAIIALAFFLFIPVVLSIIVVLVVLIGRQVILMCLVLVAPLAFVAWLLPNTEKWFKKWNEIFFQMLVLYPLIMLMFGASLYLSNLIGNPDVGTSIIGG